MKVTAYAIAIQVEYCNDKIVLQMGTITGASSIAYIMMMLIFITLQSV